MDSFFAVLASASLIFSWVSTTKVVAVVSPSKAVTAESVCASGPQYTKTAAVNAASLQTAAVKTFGRVETGWQLYAAQVARTIGSPCTPDSQAFAATLASWQKLHRLPATGAMSQATLDVLKVTWQRERPFVTQFETGSCPAAASQASLSDIVATEGWFGKVSQVDRQALADLRRMIMAARAEDPRIASDSQAFKIVSAFRSPEYDAARCARDKNCNGTTRARCSAHRTGKALDLYIGALPGHSPVGSDNANRLYQTSTPTYQWLVKNAARFGFVNYVFEPWHWEWVGKYRGPGQSPIIEATFVREKRAQPAQPIEASMLKSPPLDHLWARLRSLFGTAG